MIFDGLKFFWMRCVPLSINISSAMSSAIFVDLTADSDDGIDLTADSDDDVEVVESVWGRHTHEGGVGDSSFPTESAQTAPRQQTTSRTSAGARTVTPVKKRTVKHRDRRRDWDSLDLLTSEASPSFVYIIENDAHNVYTGSTQDPSTRLQQHNSGGSISRSLDPLGKALAPRRHHRTVPQ